MRDDGGRAKRLAQLALAFVALLALIGGLLLSSTAKAQDFPAPPQDSWILDEGEFLSAEEELALNQKLQARFEETGRPLYITTFQNLQGYPIEDFGYRLGREWGVGDAEEDDGTLLIIAREEREMRIETGYGARVYLPDVLAGRIIRNTLTPAFKQGAFAAGIDAGVDEILASFELSPEEAAARAEQAAAEQERSAQGSGGFGGMLLFMIFLFMFLSIGRRGAGMRYRGKGKRRRRRGGFDAGDAAVLLWGIDALTRGGRGGGGGIFGGGGGFGGGGFGGGLGGGGFGGGGASGGW